MEASSYPLDRARLATLIDALIARAEHGDVHAARQAVALTQGRDPIRAARALACAVALNPRDDDSRLALARLRAGSGDLNAARREAETVLETALDEAARAQAALALGDVARLEAAYAEARGHYEDVIAIEDAILAAHPGEPTALRWRARAMGRVAELDLIGENPAAAQQRARAARDILRALALQLSETPLLAADIADAELRLAEIALAEGRPTAMRPFLEQALGRYEALAVHEKAEPHWRDRLAECWALMAEAALAEGAAAEARVAMDKAVSQRVWLANKEPGERWGLAAIWRLRAGLMAALREEQAAADSLDQAAALAEKLCAEADNASEAARFLFHTRLEQADLGLRMGDLKRARDAADRARAEAEAFARQDPAWRTDLAAAWDRLGDIAKTVSAAEQAEDAFARAVELRRMSAAEQDSMSLKRALAAALLKFGEAAMDANAPGAARGAFAESFALRLELAEAYPGALAPAQDLAVALERLGLSAAAEGDLAGARAAWEQELSLVESIFPEGDEAGLRFCAIVDALLADLGGDQADAHRQRAREKLARIRALTAEDAALAARLASDF